MWQNILCGKAVKSSLFTWAHNHKTDWLLLYYKPTAIVMNSLSVSVNTISQPSQTSVVEALPGKSPGVCLLISAPSVTWGSDHWLVARGQLLGHRTSVHPRYCMSHTVLLCLPQAVSEIVLCTVYSLTLFSGHYRTTNLCLMYVHKVPLCVAL